MKIKKDYLLLFPSLGAAAALIIFSAEAKQGALYGAALAFRAVLPCLLPLMIIFGFIQLSPASAALQRLLSPLCRGVFGLPACCAPALFFGLVGGYPVGALMTQRLLENGDIDAPAARRMLRFAFSGGAGFIITSLGGGMLGSRSGGALLFLSVTLAALLSALMCRFIWGALPEGEAAFMGLPAGEALCESVQSAVRSSLCMAAYIICFCALFSGVSLPPYIAPLIEITGGCAQFSPGRPLFITAFFAAFGGLCVHLQLLPAIKSAGMRYLDFLLWRIINAVLSCAFCLALEPLFPRVQQVFSNLSQPVVRPTAANAALSAVMLLGCAVFVLDIGGRKRKC